jgi:hypothetical protein
VHEVQGYTQHAEDGAVEVEEFLGCGLGDEHSVYHGDAVGFWCCRVLRYVVSCGTGRVRMMLREYLMELFGLSMLVHDVATDLKWQYNRNHLNCTETCKYSSSAYGRH